MLSDEEKEALDKLSSKKNETTWDDTIRQIKREEIKDVVVTRQKYITSILNIIEKQSKEIEILNKNMNLLREQNISYKQSIHGLKEMNKIINKKWEDKIKAIIEEIKQRREKDGECELALYGFQREAKIEVLQSLLEKE